MVFSLPHPLYWAGDCLEFLYTGETLELCFEADFTQFEPWVSIELNGAPLLRMPLGVGQTRVCLFRGMTPGVSRHVCIYKETQPMPDDARHRLAVTQVRGDGGEFLPVPPKALCLECIGDSITSGEGLAGAAAENDWVTPFFSASRTWARRTAQLLGAEFHAVSQSGWGVCSSWLGNASHTLPRWYEETRARRTWTPDAVIVNLGTNDANALAAGVSPVDADGLCEGALRFLRLLRSEHPAAKLVWGYGMLGDSVRAPLEEAVRRFGDACFLPLPPATPATLGSRQHPGPACHEAAAQAVAALLKTILKKA